MEKITTEYGIGGLLAGLILTFCIHLIWSVYKEKSKLTDASIKILEMRMQTSVKQIEAKMHTLDIHIVTLQTKMEQFSHIVTGYMADTVNLSDKLTDVAEKIDKLKRLEGG